jgi:hypothetical protein
MIVRHIRRPMSGLAVVLFAVNMAPEAPVRAETPTEQVRKAQTRHERQAANAQQAVRELALSREQAQRLLPLVEQAAALHIESYEWEAQLLPEMIEAYADFAREDQLNQGFTKDVERRTGRVHRQAKEAREEITEQLLALEEEAAESLTPTQIELLETFHPGRWHGGGGIARGAGKQVRDRIAWKRRNDRLEDRLTRARGRLKEHVQGIHPRLGRVGEYVLHPAAAEIICEAGGFRPSNRMREAVHVYTHGKPDYPIALALSQKAEVNRLKAEINNWNLINGLNLNRDQIERIVRLYAAAGPELEGVRGRANRAAGRRKDLLFALERQVENVLNPGQRQVLADYKPCLLPPKDLKNPVRAGQANDGTQMVKWLTRARNAKNEIRRARMIENLIAREEEHLGELTDRQWEQRVDLLERIIANASAMSDVDFELNKEELAKKIEPRDVREELKGEIAELARARGLPGDIARHMLKPLFIEQLQSRAAAQSKPRRNR